MSRVAPGGKAPVATRGSRSNVAARRKLGKSPAEPDAWHGPPARGTVQACAVASSSETVAFCAIALKSPAVTRLGRRLGPLEIRRILVDAGIPQGSGGHIGRLPDTARAANQIPLLADLNCDGRADFGDIDAFVFALGGQAGYYAQYPGRLWLNADRDQGSDVHFDDLNPFVALPGG